MLYLALIAWLAFSLACPGIGWTAAIIAIVDGMVQLVALGVKLGS